MCSRTNGCCSPLPDGSIYLKVLVPSVAAGAIIGKGGETIAQVSGEQYLCLVVHTSYPLLPSTCQVQKEVNARIKMSKANDFYPGILHHVLQFASHLQPVSYTLLLLVFRHNRESLFD